MEHTKEFEGKVVSGAGRHILYDDATGRAIDWQAIRSAGLMTGIATMGYGTNVEEGLSEAEAEALLAIRYEQAKKELEARVFDGDFARFGINPQRIEALVDMVYNLGINRFLEFKQTIASIKAGDWEGAAEHALNSRWARQVGRRARKIAQILREGG